MDTDLTELNVRHDYNDGGFHGKKTRNANARTNHISQQSHGNMHAARGSQVNNYD